MSVATALAAPSNPLAAAVERRIDELDYEVQVRASALRKVAKRKAKRLEFGARLNLGKLPRNIAEMTMAEFVREFGADPEAVASQRAVEKRREVDRWAATTPGVVPRGKRLDRSQEEPEQPMSRADRRRRELREKAAAKLAEVRGEGSGNGKSKGQDRTTWGQQFLQLKQEAAKLTATLRTTRHRRKRAAIEAVPLRRSTRLSTAKKPGGIGKGRLLTRSGRRGGRAARA